MARPFIPRCALSMAAPTLLFWSPSDWSCRVMTPVHYNCYRLAYPSSLKRPACTWDAAAGGGVLSPDTWPQDDAAVDAAKHHLRSFRTSLAGYYAKEEGAKLARELCIANGDLHVQRRYTNRLGYEQQFGRGCKYVHDPNVLPTCALVDRVVLRFRTSAIATRTWHLVERCRCF